MMKPLACGRPTFVLRCLMHCAWLGGVFGAWAEPLKEHLGAVGLEISADLIESTYDLAGFACYLLLGGHIVSLVQFRGPSQGFQQEMAQFPRSVMESTPPLTSFEEIQLVIRLCIPAMKSLQTGRAYSV